MQDYDPHTGIPEGGGANANEGVATVKTIRLKQLRTSDRKSRTYIVIVFCILCVVAGLTIVLVGHERSSDNVNTQTEIPETLTTEDYKPMSAQTNSGRAVDLEATEMPTQTSSSWYPSYHPLEEPSSFPSTIPSSFPSTIPSSWPSNSPSTTLPTPAPFLPIALGQELHWTNENLGIQLSVGLSAKIIAMSGRRVMYGDGNESSQRFHGMMDGAGIVSLQNGGYVYVSNSEAEGSDGGVFGLYFDDDGRVVDYKPLLTGTTRNCGGGLSPWNTWISCEEVESRGQCWQVDPDPSSEYHRTPRKTLLGGGGGNFESVAVDNTDPFRPIFFITEDLESGALRRFIADGNGWHSLHHGGSTTFLRFFDDGTFEWTSDENYGRLSANWYYPNTEGISYHEGFLYFVSKEMKALYALDLTRMTYRREFTGGPKLSGHGSFNSQPDQIVLATMRYIYFTEDGGSSPGVFVRDASGQFFTIFQGLAGAYEDDETVGLALTPDRKRLYAGFQDAGILFEFSRDDGMSFE